MNADTTINPVEATEGGQSASDFINLTDKEVVYYYRHGGIPCNLVIPPSGNVATLSASLYGHPVSEKYNFRRPVDVFWCDYNNMPTREEMNAKILIVSNEVGMYFLGHIMSHLTCQNIVSVVPAPVDPRLISPDSVVTDAFTVWW